jgi:outer membrane protein TolC
MFIMKIKWNSGSVASIAMALFATCVSLLLPFPSRAQTPAVLSIDSCYAMAARNHPLIRQYDLIEKSKEYTISNAGKAYLPQVSITGIGAYIISGVPEISLPNSKPADKSNVQFIGIGQINQLIWDGGATRTQKEVAKANAGVDHATVDVSMYDIRERVNQLYFGILLIDEQLKTLSVLDETLARSLANVKLTTDNGLTYQPDIDQVKTELLNVEQRRIEFNFTRKGYVDMLAFLVGSTLPVTARFESPVPPESYASLTNNRPELNLYASQLSLVEAASGFDRVAVMPKVGLMGAGILIEPGMSFATTTINTLAIAGLSVSWKLDGVYKLSTNKKLDQVKIARINNQRETFLFNTNLQLKQVSNEIEKQKAILGNDDGIVALRGKIKNAYQLKYDNGMCSMTDLINAIDKENEARSTRALHQVQMLLSLYSYKTKLGH